jgi:hypothetical protein
MIKPAASRRWKPSRTMASLLGTKSAEYGGRRATRIIRTNLLNRLLRLSSAIKIPRLSTHSRTTGTTGATGGVAQLAAIDDSRQSPAGPSE